MAQYTREELLAEKARREAMREAKMPPGLPAAATSPYTREELLAEKARRDAMRGAPIQSESEEEGFNWPKFIVQQVGVGALSLPDLLVAAANVAARNKIPFMDAEVQGGSFGASDIQRRIAEEAKTSDEPPEEVPLPSSFVPQTEVPTTGAQRIAGHAARGAGSAIYGGPANMLRNAAFMAAQGAISGGAQEAGANPLLADIASGIGVHKLAKAARPLAHGVAHKMGLTEAPPPRFSDAEKSVGKYFQRTLGEEDTKRAIASLESAPEYPLTKYEPMTAEVAGGHNPLFPQLHRLRYETVGSGLPNRSAAQRELLADAFDTRTAKAASSHEIQEGLKGELKKRTRIRHAETNPIYLEVDKMREPLNPTNIKRYLKDQVEAGDLEKDVRFARGTIKPTKKMSPSEREYAKLYKQSPPAVRAQMQVPEGLYPDARRVSAASRAIRSKIQKVKRSGEKQRKVKLSEMLTEIEKDLDVIPIHKEATNKYRNLSIPVNEIEDHPGLMKVIKSTANDVTDLIFDNNSKFNVQGMKKALSDNPALMQGVREAGVRHLERSISNAGAQGSHNVLSYHKLRRYLDKHKDALAELYDADQVAFVNELSNALHGQNIAKTLGRGEGSPTYSRLVSDMGVSKGLGIKSLESASHLIPSKLGGGPLRLLLNRYSKVREADVMGVLDRALLEPEFAKSLLKGDFKTQRDFNKYVNGVLKGSIVPVSEASRRKQDDEDD